MSNQAIWQVQKCEGSDYLVEILKFLLPEYIRIFGKEVMLNAPCIVYTLYITGYHSNVKVLFAFVKKEKYR